ncbi:solute carrier family 23 protein [Bacillus salitolerans]|uniref:Solute carrier family 23 protein n=1 Tax=Bacillus salitolerans TaxID=1437434 RepID=A0ABW4LNZ1_9BACI
MKSKNQNIVLDIHEKPKAMNWISLSFQHLFAMFGATVLVPILTGLSPAVALISSGLGTLAFLLITKGQVPAYLGSSFAFITPIIAAQTLGGPEAAMLGSFLAGIVYAIVALIIKGAGYQWLMRLLPPVVVGPVIIVIGLGLAGVAVNMAMLKDTTDPQTYSLLHLSAGLVTLALVIIFSVFLKKGFLSLIPVLLGITGGYIYSLFVGLVDFTGVREAKWIQMPDFVTFYTGVNFSWDIVLLMVPVAVVTLSEHIGHQMVLSEVVKKDLIKRPGLHRSIMGDGVATIIASLIGGPPNTTYGENIGVLAITKVFSVFVIAGAAVFAIAFGFIGKVSAFIASIPTPVMGGVSILLFGIIASSGLRMMVDSKVDLGQNRNLIIVSVILVIGIGEAIIKVSENFELHGMALAAILGILLNVILPGRKEASGDLTDVEDHISK